MSTQQLLAQPTLALSWQLASAAGTTRLQLPSSFQLALATATGQPVTATVVSV